MQQFLPETMDRFIASRTVKLFLEKGHILRRTAQILGIREDNRTKANGLAFLLGAKSFSQPTVGWVFWKENLVPDGPVLEEELGHT